MRTQNVQQIEPARHGDRAVREEYESADVHGIVGDDAAWLSRSRLPRPCINGERGFIQVEGRRACCRTWPNQTEVSVPGLHFLQADSPHEIGRVIAGWLPAVRGSRAA